MKIKAAVVGATGIAGQKVLAALDNHPDFEIAALAASEVRRVRITPMLSPISRVGFAGGM